MRAVLVGDPLLRARGEQVGGVAQVIIGGDDFRAVVKFLSVFLRIVPVPGNVRQVAEVRVEAAIQWMPREAVGRGGGSRALQAPFADAGGGVAGVFQHAGEGVVVLQRLVELIVAHVGVALMHTQNQRRARGRADGRGAVMVAKLDSFFGQHVEIGRLKGRHVRLAGLTPFVLKEHADIADAQVVGQDEDDVGLALGGATKDVRKQNPNGQRQSEGAVHTRVETPEKSMKARAMIRYTPGVALRIECL